MPAKNTKGKAKGKAKNKSKDSSDQLKSIEQKPVQISAGNPVKPYSINYSNSVIIQNRCQELLKNFMKYGRHSNDDAILTTEIAEVVRRELFEYRAVLDRCAHHDIIPLLNRKIDVFGDFWVKN